MKKQAFTLVAATLAAGVSLSAMGNEPGRRDGPSRREGAPPPPPLMMALDTNRDGELSADELAEAPAALKKLDKDNSGTLTREELRPKFPPGHGGPEGRGERPGRPEGPRGGAEANTEEVVARWMKLDKNGDGELSKDELPGRMRGLLARADTDEDGVASEAELTVLAEEEFPPRDDRPGPPHEGRRGGPEGFRGSGPDGPQGRPGGGPPSPEQFVRHAMRFDANEDGQLSVEELTEMAEHLPPPPGRGPEGEGRRGGPEGRRPR